MKKLIAILLVVTMGLSMVACSFEFGTSKSSDKKKKKKKDRHETEKTEVEETDEPVETEAPYPYETEDPDETELVISTSIHNETTRSSRKPAVVADENMVIDDWTRYRVIEEGNTTYTPGDVLEIHMDLYDAPTGYYYFVLESTWTETNRTTIEWEYVDGTIYVTFSNNGSICTGETLEYYYEPDEDLIYFANHEYYMVRE